MYSLGVGIRNLINENWLWEEFDYGNKGLRCNIKLVIFDGSNFWFDYKFYFDVCVIINNWLEKEKGLYLVVLLRGIV